MAHEKIKSLIVFAAIFAIIGGISWALVNAQQTSQEDDLPQAMPKLRLFEDIRETALTYLKDTHPEAKQFTNDLTWTGGKQETGLLGSEIYIFSADGWQVTIQYPVVPNPTYDININYNIPTSSGTVSIPYAIAWTGTFTDGTITEMSYMLTQ